MGLIAHQPGIAIGGAIPSRGAFHPSSYVSYEPQTVSLQLNGTDERVSHSDVSTSMSFGNTWTIMVWVKPTTVPVTGSDHLMAMPGIDNHSTIQLLANSAGTTYEVTARDTSDGAINQRYGFGTIVQDVWTQIAVTWTGTKPLTMFIDGDSVVPSTEHANLDLTMANDTRRISIGSANSGNYFPGHFHSAAIWDVALSASEITAVYNGGSGKSFDLQGSRNGYGSAASLQHWWKLGHVSTDIGKDYGNASVPRDVMVNALNVTAEDDIVTDAP